MLGAFKPYRTYRVHDATLSEAGLAASDLKYLYRGGPGCPDRICFTGGLTFCHTNVSSRGVGGSGHGYNSLLTPAGDL